MNHIIRKEITNNIAEIPDGIANQLYVIADPLAVDGMSWQDYIKSLQECLSSSPVIVMAALVNTTSTLMTEAATTAAKWLSEALNGTDMGHSTTGDPNYTGNNTGRYQSIATFEQFKRREGMPPLSAAEIGGISTGAVVGFLILLGLAYKYNNKIIGACNDLIVALAAGGVAGAPAGEGAGAPAGEEVGEEVAV